MMHVLKMIEMGEGIQLDFKKEITNAQKIAKTIAAFSNTSGGSLLIGVGDDKTLIDIDYEEEKHMIKTAASLFCSPVVLPVFREWTLKGKNILEVIIKEGALKPYMAKDENEEYRAYIRKEDQTTMVSKEYAQILRRKNSPNSGILKITEQEKEVLEYIKKHHETSIEKFCADSGFSKKNASRIFINLTCMDVLSIHLSDQEESFKIR
jgi:predicted HTH transcriptional regulator